MPVVTNSVPKQTFMRLLLASCCGYVAAAYCCLQPKYIALPQHTIAQRQWGPEITIEATHCITRG